MAGRVGWRFVPWLAAEAETGFGFSDGDFDAGEEDFGLDDNVDGDLDDVIAGPGELGLDYLIGFYGRARLPVSDRFDVFAPAYAFVEPDSTVLAIGGNEIGFGGSDDGSAFGGGAEFDVTEAISLRADCTHYEFDDANAESCGVSLNLRFGAR